MATPKRLGFTFNAQEVADLYAACSFVARVLDDNGPVPPNSPEDAALRKAAEQLAKKLARRLGFK